MPLALAKARTADVPKDAPPTPPGDDTQLDRILKLIPTDVVVLYTGAIPFLTEVAWKYARLVGLAVGIAFVVLILFCDGRITKHAARWPQYVVRSLAFTTWGIALLWPFWSVHLTDALRGLLAIAVIAVPIIGERVLRATE